MLLTNKNSNIAVGSVISPDRKRPLLVMRINNEFYRCGLFDSKKAADRFMKELAKFCNARAANKNNINMDSANNGNADKGDASKE